jgi:hypothetical protein
MATSPAEQQLRAMLQLVTASGRAGRSVAEALGEALDDLVNALTRLPLAPTGDCG